MISSNIKRSVVINGRKSSISLEEDFWIGVQEIAKEMDIPKAKLITQIKSDKEKGFNLSSAVRVYVLEYYRQKARYR
jgi:predicted DNA-binding ribbon-helix-helix protein